MVCLEHHLTLSLSGDSFLPEELRVMCAKNVWYPAKIAALERFFTSAFFLDSCVLIRRKPFACFAENTGVLRKPCHFP